MIRFSKRHSRGFVGLFVGSRESADTGLGVGEQAVRTDTIHGLFDSGVVNLDGPFIAIFVVRSGATLVHIALLASALAIASRSVMISTVRSMVEAPERAARITVAAGLFLDHARFPLGSQATFVAASFSRLQSPRSSTDSKHWTEAHGAFRDSRRRETAVQFRATRYAPMARRTTPAMRTALREILGVPRSPI